MAARVRGGALSESAATASRPHIGIDASNLRRGGGVTHLAELLRAADPAIDPFSRVTVWGGRKTLDMLEPRPWLDRRHVRALDGTLPARLWWQRATLHRELRRQGCDLLFAPGGNAGPGFRPVVTMSRNMLPFDGDAARRYGLSAQRARIALLRVAQTRTFRAADGLIFLTETARGMIQRVTGALTARIAVIPHGILATAFRPPRPQEPFGPGRPCRLLYVSTVDRYKNQWVVVRAAGALRRAGLPVTLTLVGAGEPSALRLLRAAIAEEDPGGEFVTYVGEIAHARLPALYHDADVFVFASTCENLPNILLEAMAAALPIASSRLGVMPEVLGEAGIYFDPDDPSSIADAVRQYVAAPGLRTAKAAAAHQRALAYSWSRCARETFAFLSAVAVQSAAPAR